MARAHAASACVQSDSIKGLAQSIAKPAYHRLLIAEPTLRRAVPTLIIAFLITICFGALVQVVDQARQTRASTKRDLSALADVLAERGIAAEFDGLRRQPKEDGTQDRAYRGGKEAKGAFLVHSIEERPLRASSTGPSNESM